jgi:DNA-binding LytR/AlgR family response regulator
MQKYSCLIVEDEPLAAEVLEEYITQIPFLQLTSTCGDAIYAMEAMQEQKPDLIFLDIQLPRLKGLDFVRTLTQPPRIIITTAYEQYALQGYELNVVDYLLKPIEFGRFLTAVNKLGSAVSQPSWQGPALQQGRPAIYFNVNKKKVKLFLDEILYIESLKEYIRIFTKSKTILTRFALGEIETLLAENNFLRIHRSFVVARDKIEAFSATEVEVGGKQLPIGRSYKEAVLAGLG